MLPAGAPGQRFALVLEYDGTDFFGSQRQPARRTVQGVLEEALLRVTQCPTAVTLAGRTDAGVHALGQVASCQLVTRLGPGELLRALNAVLPDDMAVLRCVAVPERFSARFSAQSRDYRYEIINRPQRSPLWRRRAHYVWQRLDVEAMDKGCRELLGKHDFASFSGAGRRERTVRTVSHATCLRVGTRVRVELRADAFLPHMVRNIVGTLIWLGTGKLDLPGFVGVIRAAERRLAGPTAPPEGLYLARVNYGDEWQGVFG
ncbi:MAG: tRNA pseudouridine(38-40) synthase TruA [Chloroflexi bacterium]|nr:tRNA pseudouridine(38-40) synthase TruA [Chloroflexota bacterium]MCL5109912.1 tRNA pseudouridine(38-40) synthase TruA [Chloroflexota bacterium]